MILCYDRLFLWYCLRLVLVLPVFGIIIPLVIGVMVVLLGSPWFIMIHDNVSRVSRSLSDGYSVAMHGMPLVKNSGMTRLLGVVMFCLPPNCMGVSLTMDPPSRRCVAEWIDLPARPPVRCAYSWNMRSTRSPSSVCGTVAKDPILMLFIEDPPIPEMLTALSGRAC